MVETNLWFIMIYFDTTSWLWISYRTWVQPPKKQTAPLFSNYPVEKASRNPSQHCATGYRLCIHLTEIHGYVQGYTLEVQQTTSSNVESKVHIDKNQVPQPLFVDFFWFLSLCLRNLLYRSSFDAFFGLFQRILDRLFYSRKIWDMMQVLSWRVAKLRHANTDSDLVITGDGVNLALPESGRVLVRTLILISKQIHQEATNILSCV